MMKLLIISGTYNEKENMGPLIDRVMGLGFDDQSISCHYLIVDDNSPDGTAGVIREKQREYPSSLHLIQRPGKEGLGSAYLCAFHWALEHGYHAICQLDADFSHNPAYIPEMLRLLQSGLDFVIGSRYVPGGAAKDWRSERKILSRCGAFYAQIVMGLEFQDVTGGFNMWRDCVLQELLTKNLQANGFFFQLECKYHAYNSGFLSKEFPIEFVDRKVGVSKMSHKIFWEALWLAHKVTHFRFLKQVLRFGCTGLLGSVSNLLFFYLTTSYYEILPLNVSAILAFIVAASQNYVINSFWTFRHEASVYLESLSWSKWLKFLFSSLSGLSINLVVLNTILWLSPHSSKVLAQALGIFLGMAINFLMSKYYVFGKRSKTGTK